MPRSVNAVASRRRRKKVLKMAKGYFGRKKNVWTVAKNQVEKGLTYAYRDRRNKKRTFRALWIQRINAGVRQYSWSYSQFMKHLYGPHGKQIRATDPFGTTTTGTTTTEGGEEDRPDGDGGPDSGIRLNRKILSELAMYEPYSFKAVIDVLEETTGVYQIPAQYTPEHGWDFDDSTGVHMEDDYYYDPETTEWLPTAERKTQQQQQKQHE